MSRAPPHFSSGPAPPFPSLSHPLPAPPNLSLFPPYSPLGLGSSVAHLPHHIRSMPIAPHPRDTGPPSPHPPASPLRSSPSLPVVGRAQWWSTVMLPSPPACGGAAVARSPLSWWVGMESRVWPRPHFSSSWGWGQTGLLPQPSPPRGRA